jgi:hypothetical protein
MSSRRHLAVVVIGLAVPCGLVITLAGCFRLGVSGLLLVAFMATVAAAIAAAVSEHDPSAAVGRAGTAAIWTAAVLLLVAGVDALGGDVVAAVLAALAGAALVGRGALRALGGGSALRTGRTGTPRVGPARPAGVRDPQVRATLRDMAAPVSRVSTTELGREWLRTAAVLAGPLDPETHQSVLGRRSEALDELERRDPVGFSRWLAHESCPRSDPADFVRAPSSPEG